LSYRRYRPRSECKQDFTPRSPVNSVSRRTPGARSCERGAAERVESARVLSVQRGRRHRPLPEGLRLRRLRVDQGYLRGVEPDRLPARQRSARHHAGGRAVVAWPRTVGPCETWVRRGARIDCGGFMRAPTFPLRLAEG